MIDGSNQLQRWSVQFLRIPSSSGPSTWAGHSWPSSFPRVDPLYDGRNHLATHLQASAALA